MTPPEFHYRSTKIGKIHLIELKKWDKVDRQKGEIVTSSHRWFWFFDYGAEIDLDYPPPF